MRCCGLAYAKGVFYSSTVQPHAMTGSAIANIHLDNLATILTIRLDIIPPCGQGLPLMLVNINRDFPNTLR